MAADPHEPIVLTRCENGDWMAPPRKTLNAKQCALLDTYHVDRDVDLLMSLIRDPLSHRDMIIEQVKMISYWLGTAEHEIVYSQYKVVEHPDCPADYMLYIQLVLLSTFPVTQDMFMEACNELRLQNFMSWLTYCFDLLYSACTSPCNAQALIEQFLEMVKAPLILGDYTPGVDVFSLVQSRILLEKDLTCVNPQFKSKLLTYDYDDLVRYSTIKPCVFLMPEWQRNQPPKPKFKVNYSTRQVIPFMPLITNPGEWVPQMTKEQYDTFREGWVKDCEMDKGKARVEERNILNRKIAEEQGIVFKPVDRIKNDHTDMDADDLKFLKKYSKRRKNFVEEGAADELDYDDPDNFDEDDEDDDDKEFADYDDGENSGGEERMEDEGEGDENDDEGEGEDYEGEDMYPDD